MSELGKLLIVDDEPTNRNILGEIFDEDEYDQKIAEDGEQALDILKTFSPDVILLDIMMPGMNGYEVCKTIRASGKFPLTKIILVSGKAMIEERLEGYAAGADDYVTKPFDNEELEAKVKVYISLVQAEHKLQDFNKALEKEVQERTKELELTTQELEESYTDSITMLTRVVELSQRDQPGMVREIAKLAEKLAKRIKLDKNEVEHVYHAGLLLHVGRIGADKTLLNSKVEELSLEQRAQFEEIPIIAETILLTTKWTQVPAKLVRHHRELFDGSGYPDRLQGEDIPLGSRILAICYDFVELKRGLLIAEKMTPIEALKYLEGNAGKRYDPELIEAFAKVLESAGTDVFQKEMKLSPLALTKGMVVTRDLHTSDGTLLLPQGTRLDENLVQNLQRLENNSLEGFIVYVKEF